MLHILIASDHQPFREALTRLLVAQPLFNVMAVCADTHAAIAISGHQQPDIVLIDGCSDPLSAIEATKKILSVSGANVIALSCQPDADFADHMMAAGALGYLSKQSLSAEIITAIMEVAKDNVYSCLENKHVPVPTPEHVSAFKKTVAAIRDNSRRKITKAMESHWHGILRFTN
jgi:DNA-binding NarL/FixJ family response regulator